MSLTVGQLAKIAGLTVRALHHYDARGLLVPSQRSEAGYRLYSQADVIRLYRIQALQRIGLSLADIAHALDRDTESLPQLIAQQLAELDEQIERSTQLRDQLSRLSTRLATPAGPQMADWLTALGLLNTYDKHCSADEIEQLLANSNDDQWPPFIRDLRSAMERRIALDSNEARALARRWTQLSMARFGGDARLAKKMKQMYIDDASVQARVQSQSGFDMEMMQFCIRITTEAHLAYWARHLTTDELTRVHMTDEWGRELLSVVGDLREQMTAQSADPKSIRDRWDRLMLMFAAGDPQLQRKLDSALWSDADLQELWGVSTRLRDWLVHQSEDVQ